MRVHNCWKLPFRHRNCWHAHATFRDLFNPPNLISHAPKSPVCIPTFSFDSYDNFIFNQNVLSTLEKENLLSHAVQPPTRFSSSYRTKSRTRKKRRYFSNVKNRKKKSDVKTLIPQIQEKGGGLMDMAFYFQRKAWQNEKKQKNPHFPALIDKNREENGPIAAMQTWNRWHTACHTHTLDMSHISFKQTSIPHTHTHITIKRRKWFTATGDKFRKPSLLFPPHPEN